MESSQGYNGYQERYSTTSNNSLSLMVDKIDASLAEIEKANSKIKK